MKTLKFLLLFMLIPTLCFSGIDFNGDADYLNCDATNIPTSYPITMYVLFDADTNTTAAGTADSMLTLNNTSSTNDWVQMDFWNDSGTKKVRFVIRQDNPYNPAISGSVSGIVCAVGVGIDSTDRKLYINGSQDGTNTTANLYSDNVNTILIGAYENNTGPKNFFDGVIYETGVWDTNLSVPEIELLCNSKIKRIALQIKPANLIGYWSLDDGADGVAISTDANFYKDLSSNVNSCQGVDGDGDSTNEAETVLTYP
jgi:hypothetical protein